MLMLIVVFFLLGMALGYFRRRSGQGICYVLAFMLLIISGCGLLPATLLKHLQAPYVTRPDIVWAPRNAIVLLGAGTARISDTEHIVPTIYANGRMLQSYALYRSCRQKQVDCKLIISGGDPYRNGVAEANAYAKIMQSLGVDPADLVLETRSKNTWQNAQFVQPLIASYKPQNIVLVSSALQLRRAQRYFIHFGLDTTPVRADYVQARLTWFPNAWNMALTDFAIHEYIGMLTYHVYNTLGWNPPPTLSSAIVNK